jgi:PBP1b-binding outer membrane lipoprotein LpoB
MKRILILFLPFILLSCGEPEINASTDEALKSSVENIKNDLPDGKKEDFEKALMTIALSNLDLANALKGNIDGDLYSKNLLSKVKNQLNGKTANEIIDKAESIRQTRKEKQRVQALKEIQELEQKRKAAQKDQEKLNDFEVIRSRFYLQEDTYRSQPIIDLTVHNNTEHAISRVYFEGTYASPDREVPWLKESFNYKISGGIEPGEKKSWSLAPNQFGEWGEIEEKSDAVLTVETVRIDDPNGETLFDSQGLSEFEKQRLIELKKEYSVE